VREQRGVSEILVAEGEERFDSDRALAVFDRHVERLQWSGRDLLVAFARLPEVHMFSVFPGLRIRPASAPPGAPPELAWLRLTTRRARR
jgi:hypothetical protein